MPMTDQHDEHYESIPWDALVTDDARRRRRWLYLAAGLILALGLGGAIGRSLSSGAPVSSPVTSTAPSVGTSLTSVVAVEQTQPSTAEETAAMSYAAWFVADYFTVDGSEVTRQSVIDRLPAGVDLPQPDNAARSFVESVFPISVDEVAGGRYRVVAVVRALAAADGESYQRQPARAVAVTVSAEVDGVAIVDLPRPVPLPDPAVAGLDLELGEAPEVVLDAAKNEAELWGTPVVPPSTAQVGDLWRVMYLVEDEAGLTWPVAMWFDGDGESASAG